MSDSPTKETGNPAKCQPVRWNGRDATRLSNGVIELTALTCGGHLADLHFTSRDGFSSENVMWQAPWPTVDAEQFPRADTDQRWGSGVAAKFLAGYTGHALCLDYFGEPSPEAAARGFSVHGEAAVMRWNVTPTIESKDTDCQWTAKLPEAQLGFSREIRLGDGESVAYITEPVVNERAREHSFDWVQHVTFGPPFLDAGESTLAVSGERGMTFPSSYEGGSLLEANQAFTWPYAPQRDNGDLADLRQPFRTPGKGFLANLRLDPQREIQYLLAVNWKLRLAVGYCFRRNDFPWMTLWEENQARTGAPWLGKTQARGMEFGTTPHPTGPRTTNHHENLFGTPGGCRLSVGGRKTARYLMFLAMIPLGIDSLNNVEIEDHKIVLYDRDKKQTTTVQTHGVANFLSGSSE